MRRRGVRLGVVLAVLTTVVGAIGAALHGLFGHVDASPAPPVEFPEFDEYRP